MHSHWLRFSFPSWLSSVVQLMHILAEFQSPALFLQKIAKWKQCQLFILWLSQTFFFFAFASWKRVKRRLAIWHINYTVIVTPLNESSRRKIQKPHFLFAQESDATVHIRNFISKLAWNKITKDMNGLLRLGQFQFISCATPHGVGLHPHTLGWFTSAPSAGAPSDCINQHDKKGVLWAVGSNEI